MKYSNFEDWFNEIENYGLRSERFYEEFPNIDPRMIEWLKASWECAREKK